MSVAIKEGERNQGEAFKKLKPERGGKSLVMDEFGHSKPTTFRKREGAHTEKNLPKKELHFGGKVGQKMNIREKGAR